MNQIAMNKVHLICLLLAMVASTMTGCGRGVKLVKVSGKVMIDGKPLERGFVQVIPKDSRAASGEIGQDGKFTLTTFDNGDGCVLGNHTVTVLANESKGPTALHWYAPKKYSDPATSGLTLDIQAATDTADINLSWEGGKPYTETFSDEGAVLGSPTPAPESN